jgi:hypothetical protein
MAKGNYNTRSATLAMKAAAQILLSLKAPIVNKSVTQYNLRSRHQSTTKKESVTPPPIHRYNLRSSSLKCAL